LAAAVIDQSLRSGPAGDLISHLRETRPHLPIVLLTSSGARSPQSAPQDATVFRVPKPLKPAALYEAMQQAIVGLAAAGPDPGGSRAAVVRLADTIPLDILLVEDNPVNQKVALRFLQRLGYRADAVANGREAVQATRQRDYKLVFMDVQMPEMDGFAATREIRGLLPKARQPVIIALTANAMQGDREKCLESGMDDFITKPVRIDEIEHMIRRFFAPGAPANAP
jgi:CheY-like chemotaxis protein